jgi:transgelin
VLDWIEAVLGEKIPAQPYEDVLRDGIILCKMMNKIAPGSVNKIQTSGGSFKLMENIQRLALFSFLQGRVSFNFSVI